MAAELETFQEHFEATLEDEPAACPHAQQWERNPYAVSWYHHTPHLPHWHVLKASIEEELKKIYACTVKLLVVFDKT